MLLILGKLLAEEAIQNMALRTSAEPVETVQTAQNTSSRGESTIGDDLL